MELTSIEMREVCDAYGAFDYNDYFLFFDDEEAYKTYKKKGEKFWGFIAELLTYLTSDGDYHQKITYYSDQDGMLVIVNDDCPYFTDEFVESAILDELGLQHPDRVIDVLMKIGSLKSDMNYVVIDHDHEMEGDFEHTLEIMEVEEEVFGEYTPSFTHKRGEFWVGKAIDEQGKTFYFQKDYSYYQGSPDYCGFLIDKEKYEEYKN